jgi:ParB family chromosome partitioning protein
VQPKLSVRDAESVARARSRSAPTGPARASSTDPDVRRLADDLTRALGTKVAIHLGQAGAGRIEIAFYSDDDLARISDLLTAPRAVARTAR